MLATAYLTEFFISLCVFSDICDYTKLVRKTNEVINILLQLKTSCSTRAIPPKSPACLSLIVGFPLVN